MIGQARSCRRDRVPLRARGSVLTDGAGRAAGKLLPVFALVLLAACDVGGLSRAQTTEVNGFDVRVSQIERQPPTYRAAGAAARDRKRLDGAYYVRNVVGIRRVSGCPIRPDTISHEPDGPATTAAVACP